MINTKSIIEKWYTKLGFPEKYNVEFYSALESTDIPENTSIENYDMECSDGKKNLLSFLYMCENVEKQYKNLGISDAVMLDTLHDIAVWCETWSDVKGELFLGEITWLKRHMQFKLFKLGRLQFCIAGAEYDIPKYSIKKVDPIIEIHIQAGGKLDTDECLCSIKSAKAFFNEYFPEYRYSYFTCHSWLLDEKLKELLPETSNIIKFGNLFDRVRADDSNALIRYIFTWDTNESNLNEKTAPNSFAERVREKIFSGESFSETIGVIKA